MTSKEFTFWLKGYIKALPKDANITQIIDDITNQLEQVDKIDLPKADREAEKKLDDWLRDLEKSKDYIPIFPNPYPVVMYGCQSVPYTPIYNPIIKTTTSINNNLTYCDTCSTKSEENCKSCVFNK